MQSDWSEFFSSQRQQTEAAGQLRSPMGFDASVCNFGSNDYLGLSQHPAVLQAARDAIDRPTGGAPIESSATGPMAAGERVLASRWGSGASPVIGGHGTWHQELDGGLAELAAAPAAISFSSGYGCNVGVLAALAGPGDLILSDQLNHASLIDGCRLSRAERVVYPHLDVGFVAEQLRARAAGCNKVLIVTESIFSMDGDAAPLAALNQLAQQYQAALVVDEAHATGLYGARGAGLLEELQLVSHGPGVAQPSAMRSVSQAAWPEHLIKLGTLSKALGSIGGFVCGSSACIDFLVNRCRSYLFSTALPGPAAAAAAQAVQLVPSLGPQREHVHALSQQLRAQLREAGWQVADGASPIVPVVVGSASAAVDVSRRLLRQGFFVPAIRPPTVPHGTARLRMSLTALHTEENVASLVIAMGPRPGP